MMTTIAAAGAPSRASDQARAFVHPASVHNFVNESSATAEFYVAYFVPEGAAPLLRDEPVPPECV